MSPPHVDLVVLTRDAGPLDPRVERGIAAQRSVVLRVHRVVGDRREGDVGRLDAICRARDAAAALGESPRVMFLDDDVVLGEGCVARLAAALDAHPWYAALAADYLGERRGSDARRRPDPRRHVAMGATMFRRSELRRVRFRWEPGRCECQFCCDDLRAAGLGVAYLPNAEARHLRGPETGGGREAAAAPHVLAAFDRRHVGKFREWFLRTLRRHGNAGPVVAVGYGLYPSERSAIAALPGVRLEDRRVTGVMPPVRRLRDFASIVEGLPSETPVAYWDAGDVVFQTRLDPLWDAVRRNPDRLLAAREPKSHPDNPAVRAWTLSVTDPEMRAKAFDLLSRSPFLNSGFAAGTARAMLSYFREADRMMHSPDLAGTTDWGDQTALNLYCHSRPGRWLEVGETWNYCLHDRRPREGRVRADGFVVDAGGRPVAVVHGNARSLRKLSLRRDL